MIVFAAATLARSRRHAILLASYAGMAIAIATIELLTAGFTDHFNASAPRRDVLAVPLVALFFAVFGLRAALGQPADTAANWIFRIAPPSVAHARQASRLLVTWLGALPVLFVTAAAALWLWPAGVALEVVTLDACAALLLVEVAFSKWNKVPCGSLHAAATETVKSRWPLLVLCLYLFAFRGADLDMFALRHPAAIWIVAGVALLVGVAVQRRQDQRGAAEQTTIDVVLDGLPLQLLESDV